MEIALAPHYGRDPGSQSALFHPTMTDHIYHDEFGFYSPMPIDRAARREPEADFPTGPEPGERLPEIVLSDQTGATVDVAAHHGRRGSVIVFHRSAYW